MWADLCVGGGNPWLPHLFSCSNFHTPPTPLPNPSSMPTSSRKHSSATPCWLNTPFSEHPDATQSHTMFRWLQEPERAVQAKPPAPGSRDQGWHFSALLRSTECNTGHHSINPSRRVKCCSAGVFAVGHHPDPLEQWCTPPPTSCCMCWDRHPQLSTPALGDNSCWLS